MQYRDDGYLPEALLNYLARLGWSHGDEEMFSREQLVEWFDLEHVSRSPAQFDPREAGVAERSSTSRRRTTSGSRELVAPLLAADGGDPARGPPLAAVVALLRSARSTLKELAERGGVFLRATSHRRPSCSRAARDRRSEAGAARAGRALRDRRPWERSGDQGGASKAR